MHTSINTSCFEEFPQLESERLRFRSFETNDAAHLLNIRSNKEVMHFMDSPPLKTINEARQLINQIQQGFQEQKGLQWVLEERSSQAFIGYFGYWRIVSAHCRGEIGYALLPDYWGKGYMREAMQRLIQFGFERLWLHSIEANVNPNNQRSMRLLEQMGFVREAYFRENYLFDNQFLDSAIYCLLERDFK